MRDFKLVEKESQNVGMYAKEAGRLEAAIEKLKRCDFGKHYVPNTEYPASVKVRVVTTVGESKQLVVHGEVLESKPIARAIHALLLIDLQEQLAGASQKMEDSIRETQSE